MKSTKFKTRFVAILLAVSLACGNVVAIWADDPIVPAQNSESETLTPQFSFENDEEIVKGEQGEAVQLPKDVEGLAEETKLGDLAEENSLKEEAIEDADAEGSAEEEIADDPSQELKEPLLVVGTLSISSLDKTNGTALICVKDLVSLLGFKSVEAKVWSKKNKSDLYTYSMTDQGDGTWNVPMDIVNHNSYKGEYNIEILTIENDDTETIAASGTVDFSGFTGILTSTKSPSNGKYTVQVTDFSSSEPVAGLRVALWSETKGQDDLLWHDMIPDAAGTTYNFTSNLNDFNNFGQYNAHFYVVFPDGEEEFFGETTFSVEAPKSTGITVKTDVKAGSIDVTLTDVTSECIITKCRVCIWRQPDKSDRKWYLMTKNSSSEYELTGANIQEFNSYSGTYNAVVYAHTKNGPKHKMATKKFSIATSNGAMSFSDKYAGIKGEEQKVYTLRIRGLARANGISKVQFKVWAYKDPSKVKWYTASYKNGFYRADVPISDFKLGDKYRAQVYVTETNGVRKCVKTKDVMDVNGNIAGKVTLTQSDPAAGTFTVALKNNKAPSGLNIVKFTIWTAPDKSDARTYKTTKYSDGSFRANVNISTFAYQTGTYYVKARGEMGNGVTRYRGTATLTFDVANDFAYVQKTGSGKRTLGLINPTFGDIRFAVWSEQNGKDDLKWFDGSLFGNRWLYKLDLLDFEVAGAYGMQVYSGDNLLLETSFTVAEGEAGKTGWFYENGLKFYYKRGKKQTDLTGMVSGPYQICVNRKCNTITVYAWDSAKNWYIVPVIAFACSTGLPGMETPTGVYYTYAKNRYEELMGPSWGQYSARVVDGIYIHSVPSNIQSNPHRGISWEEYNKLGSFASHGCIRVNVQAAKWIYDHCSVGTQVKIYDDSNPGPFGKPETVKIGPGIDWDPTDPEI